MKKTQLDTLKRKIFLKLICYNFSIFIHMKIFVDIKIDLNKFLDI